MKKTIKKIVFFSTCIGIGFSSLKINHCSIESKKFTKKVESFTDGFIEDDTEIIAHRGFSSLEMENSIDSISTCKDKGYIDKIEIDLQRTKDNHLVLWHNKYIKTKQNITLNINDLTLEQLKKYEIHPPSSLANIYLKNSFNNLSGNSNRKRASNISNKDVSIKSLNEVLNSYNQSQGLILDLKFNDDTEDFIKALKNETTNIDCSKYTFQSDSIKSLLYLKSIYPNRKYQVIIKKEEDLVFANMFDEVALKKDLATFECVDNLLNKNKKVSIWTINSTDFNEISTNLRGNRDNISYITNEADSLSYLINSKVKRK